MKLSKRLVALVATTLVLSSGSLIAKATLETPRFCSGLARPEPRDAPGGERLSLGEARSRAGFEIRTPRHRYANDALIRRVWLLEAINDEVPPGRIASVLIDYQSGIRIGYNRAEAQERDDPEAFYRSLTKAYDLSLKSIEGRPALVNDDMSGRCWTRPTLSTVLNGVSIRVEADYAPVYPIAGAGVIEDVAASLIGGDA